MCYSSFNVILFWLFYWDTNVLRGNNNLNKIIKRDTYVPRTMRTRLTRWLANTYIWRLSIVTHYKRILIYREDCHTKHMKAGYNAGPGKSWKSTHSHKTFSLKAFVCSIIFFDFYFIRVYCFNYCAFGRPNWVLEKSWKIVPEKGYETLHRVFRLWTFWLLTASHVDFDPN